nr:putative ribonuclease h protein [Quercus suber]
MNAKVCALMTENGASWDEDKDLFMGILNKHDHHLAERFAVIAWSIWYKRNATWTSSSSLPRTQIHADALERLNEFHQAQDIPMVSHQPSTPVHWCPPPNSWCKVNFDGAIFQELGDAGIGVVIRDHVGKVIGAMSERIALPPSLEHVEALACRRATLFAKDFNLQAVTFEGDSETIINYLKSDEDCLAPFGHLIEDSRYLASSFQAVTFSHVKRNGNSVADKLAKLAR